MQEVKIITENGRVNLYSPYDKETPVRAKKIGGKWNPTEKCWSFDERDLDKVKDLAKDIYGYVDENEPTVDVKLHLEDGDLRDGNQLRIGGRVLATRRQRDWNVTFPENVIVDEGDFGPSGGSRANPDVWGYDCTHTVTLEVRGVPQGFVEKLKEEKLSFEIINGEDAVKAALRKEKEQLLKRLAEIDKELGE